MTAPLNKKLCSIKLSSIPKVTTGPSVFTSQLPVYLHINEINDEQYSIDDDSRHKPFIFGPQSTSRVFPPNYDPINYKPKTNSPSYGSINVGGTISGVLDDGVTIIKVVL